MAQMSQMIHSCFSVLEVQYPLQGVGFGIKLGGTDKKCRTYEEKTENKHGYHKTLVKLFHFMKWLD